MSQEKGLLPKVAVITVYYNRPDNIEESIQSLISQTYENLDIYIIDDRSKDQTYQNLTKKVTNVNRVTLLQNDVNKGFTNSLIDTIARLDVKYVAIHGAGDISSETRIAEQVNFMENNPEVGVVTTSLIQNKAHRQQNKIITLDDLLTKNRITHGAVMFKLDDYKKAGGYRSFFTSRQDKDLWYRMALVTKLALLDLPLYKIVQIQNSVSLNSSKNAIPTLLSSFATHLIKERMVQGKDSLDMYGDKSALFYNPVLCNKLFYRNIKKNIFKKRFETATDYINILLKTNTNGFHKFILKAVKKSIKIIKR